MVCITYFGFCKSNTVSNGKYTYGRVNQKLWRSPSELSRPGSSDGGDCLDLYRMEKRMVYSTLILGQWIGRLAFLDKDKKPWRAPVHVAHMKHPLAVVN